MERIIDANLNRTNEALRVLEEIARFYLDNKKISEELKLMRHKISQFFDKDYEKLLSSRDTQNDVGVDISNPTKRNGIETIFRANIKRLQEALRVLSEYGNLPDEFRYESYTIEIKLNEGIKMNLKKYLLNNRKLYLVTNSDNFKTEDEFLDTIALALKGGVDTVQLREKTKSAKEIIQIGKKIRELCSMYEALFIVNDRIDLAQILNADGIHLGQEDINIKQARKILGTNMIIGISTHKPEDAIKAQEDGADYIGVGPVFKTPTKPDKIPVGLEYVKWAAENVKIPFFAIGSIDLCNVGKVIEVGASRVALIRAIMNAIDVEKTASEFKDLLAENFHQDVH